MLRTLRNCIYLAVFVLLTSGSCLASPVNLNLNFTDGVSWLIPFSSGGISFTNNNVFVYFEPGPVETDVLSGHTSYTTYGPGGSVNIYANGVEYTGAFTSADSVWSIGTVLETVMFGGSFTLNGFTGLGSLGVAENSCPNEPGECFITEGGLSFSGTQTPEPGSLLLMLSGAGILTALARRRILA